MITYQIDLCTKVLFSYLEYSTLRYKVLREDNISERLTS